MGRGDKHRGGKANVSSSLKHGLLENYYSPNKGSNETFVQIEVNKQNEDGHDPDLDQAYWMPQKMRGDN